MSEIEQSGFSHFDQWLALVRRTRELLDAAIGEGELPAGGADYLADLTLPHLEAVQAGFVGWLRADTAGLAELRYLLSLVGTARIPPATSDPDRRAADAEAEMERSLTASGARGCPLSRRSTDLLGHPGTARTRGAREPARRAGATALADGQRQNPESRRPGLPPGVRVLRRGRSPWPSGVPGRRLTDTELKRPRVTTRQFRWSALVSSPPTPAAQPTGARSPGRSAADRPPRPARSEGG